MAIGDKKSAVMEADIGVKGGVSPYLHASQHSVLGADPIIPEMIGALAVNNMHYSGNIDEIFNGAFLVLSDATGDMPWTNKWFDLVAFPSGTGACSQIAMHTSSNGEPTGFKFRHHNGNVWSPWSTTATTDYAVNKAGDTMTGALTVNANYAAFIARDADDNSGALGEFEHYNGISKIGSTRNGVSREIHIRSSSVAPNIADALALYDSESNNWYYILHSGNKLSGNYTGNGSSTLREIDLTTNVNCNGVIIVGTSGYMALITSQGGIIKNGSDTSVIGLPTTQVNWNDGKIKITSTHDALNKNGETYFYQCL